MAKRSPRPPAPRGLGVAGKALWRRIIGDLPDGWALDERELRALEQAAKCADDLARLEKAIAAEGYTVAGSQGQLRPHPGLDVLVRLRSLEAQLLRSLELEPPRARTPAELRGAKAAATRWATRARRGEEV